MYREYSPAAVNMRLSSSTTIVPKPIHAFVARTGSTRKPNEAFNFAFT